MLTPTSSRLLTTGLLAVLGAIPALQAQEATAATKPKGPDFTAAQQKGIDFLLSQAKDGKFLQRDEPHVGVTGLALGAVLTKPASLRNDKESKFVEQASDWLLEQQHDDGSFGESIKNYQTSAVAMALSKLEGDKASKALSKARDFLQFAQNVEKAGIPKDDKSWGGFGYGPGDRADMSNTQFAIETLHVTGLDPNDKAFANALVFLQRVQNLKSVNDYRTEVSEEGSEETHPVEPGNDGGASYYPGNSKFGFDVVGDGVRVPRSYGSMTYALLKTYALCGLDADDERMQAATDWIRRNWTLETNPGNHSGLDENAPYQGLFYYYETMARALTVCGIETIETLGDEQSKQVNWREALASHLESIQRDDGSWLNEENGRWWEDQPTMCTIYALLALADCHGHGAQGAR